MTVTARFSVVVAAIISIAAPDWLSAQSVIFGDVPGRRQADVHNPFSPRYLDMQPNGAARRGVSRAAPLPQVNNHNGHHHHHHGGGFGLGFGFAPVIGWQSTGIGFGVNNGFNNGWGFNNGFGWNSYYGTPYYDYGWGYGVFPPIDATNIFGLGVVDQMWAPDPRPVRQRNPGVPVDPGRNVVPADDVRDLNPHRNELASKYIEYGDRQFAAGDYNQAQLKYRKAVNIAPTQAVPRIRRGQAFLALGRYSQAAEEIYRGLQLDPEWIGSKFKLQNLYHARPADLDAHVQALTQALAMRPGDADLEFLLGWQLHFTGRTVEARPHFEQAVAAGSSHDKLVKDVLAATAPPKALVKLEAPPPPVKKNPPQGAKMPGAPAAPRVPAAPEAPVDEPDQPDLPADVPDVEI